MWVVVKHFEKFPRLFAGQLICVNVLPQMSPEWCIYSWRGYFLPVGGKLCLLCIGVYKKEIKRAFALKICKCLIKNNFFFWKGSFQGKVQRYFHKTGALSAFVARWLKKREILKWPPEEQLGRQSAFIVRPPHLSAQFPGFSTSHQKQPIIIFSTNRKWEHKFPKSIKVDRYSEFVWPYEQLYKH